jgi:anhydro-N-acetylmuramic acid kinase
MSGTSLDGLDLCLAAFRQNENGEWQHEILAAQTISYSQEWLEKLQRAHTLNAFEFVALHKEYGKFLGEQSADFLHKKNLKADYLASHGHTIFHQPERGITFQLGDGNALAAAASVSTLFDFRSLDVALGGQGAPLVPVGDRLLFSEYDSCLNLGGFANISFEQSGNRVAFDVCPCNIVLNALSKIAGKNYDEDGLLAAQGKLDESLLCELNSLDFYAQQGAKSLGREWVEEVFYKKIEASNISLQDKLRTVCEHVAIQVSRSAQGKKMLVTGGGAFNKFLMQRIADLCACKVVIPDAQVVNFKEALVFAFLGALHVRNQANCLSSSTGAKQCCVGGCLVKMG